MTRQEAFEQSRQDWKDEEERRDHDHCYAFYTDSCKWLATIEEAQELVKMLNEKLKRLNKSLKTDAQVLSHYAQPDAMGRWGMATIDLKGARRLVSLLDNAVNGLKRFEEEADNF